MGDLFKVPLGVGEVAKAVIEPVKNVDVGAGKGKVLEVELQGGVVGLIFDGRGRPLVMPDNPKERVEKLSKWVMALEVYPEEGYKKLVGR